MSSGAALTQLVTNHSPVFDAMSVTPCYNNTNNIECAQQCMMGGGDRDSNFDMNSCVLKCKKQDCEKRCEDSGRDMFGSEQKGIQENYVKNCKSQC